MVEELLVLAAGRDFERVARQVVHVLRLRQQVERCRAPRVVGDRGAGRRGVARAAHRRHDRVRERGARTVGVCVRMDRRSLVDARANARHDPAEVAVRVVEAELACTERRAGAVACLLLTARHGRVAEHEARGVALARAVLAGDQRARACTAVELARVAALVATHLEGERVGRRVQQGERVVLVTVVVDAALERTGVVDVAVALALRTHHAGDQGVVDERLVDEAVHLEQAAGAADHARFTLEVVLGARVDEVHRTADRVAAVQRALRAAEDLHPLDVEQAAFRRGDKEVLGVDAVQVGRHARVTTDGAEQPADAADRDVVGLDRRRRRVVLQVFLVAKTEVLDELVAERGDGDGGVLHRRFRPLGRDHDLLDLSAFRRERRRRGCECGTR